MPPTHRPHERIDSSSAAFAAFYTAHFDEVLRFVARRSADAHTAADLTADVFVAALEQAGTFRGDGSARAWLFGIARNVVHSAYRRAEREGEATRRLHGSRLLTADDIAGIEDRIDAERAAGTAYANLTSLPPAERAVLELVVVDQLTVGEAAHALGIRSTTARVRLLRARRRLRSTVSSPVDPLPAHQS